MAKVVITIEDCEDTKEVLLTIDYGIDVCDSLKPSKLTLAQKMGNTINDFKFDILSLSLTEETGKNDEQCNNTKH